MRISDWSSDVCSSDLLTGLAQKYFGGDPLVAGEPPVEWGIALDVEEPQSVGADRALNVIAAHAHHPGDLIIIDFGTATTFDVVDYSGVYKGGHIAPGSTFSPDALVTAAARLPTHSFAAPTRSTVFWLDTFRQLRIGILSGQC